MAPRWPRQPQEERLVARWPLTGGQRFPSQKWNEALRLERGHCHWGVADFTTQSKNSKLSVFLIPSPPHFFSQSNKFWPVITYAPPHSSKSAFVQENRGLFSLPYQRPRKGERSVWPAICASLGTMKRWKQAPWARGCHFRPAECLGGPGKEEVEEGLCLTFWKHNSPWGGLLQTGRVWAGSERSCHSAHAAHSHSLWSAGK